VSVLLSWAWQWIWFQRGVRLITGPIGRLPRVGGLASDGRPTLPAAAKLVGIEPTKPIAEASDASDAPLSARVTDQRTR
jgi:hypothetical protein